jgi:hypothetical protein
MRVPVRQVLDKLEAIMAVLADHGSRVAKVEALSP